MKAKQSMIHKYKTNSLKESVLKFNEKAQREGSLKYEGFNCKEISISEDQKSLIYDVEITDPDIKTFHESGIGKFAMVSKGYRESDGEYTVSEIETIKYKV